MVIALVVVTACSDDNNNAPSSSSPSINTESAVQPAWRLAATPVATSKTLDIAFLTGGCVKFDRMEVDETSEVVTITVYVNNHKAPDAPTATGCTSEGRVEVKQVSLKEPLGDRKIAGMCDAEAAAAKLPSDQSTADRECLSVNNR